jgi:exonuclease VII small subunit
MNDTGFITYLLDDNAKKMRSTANTLESASKRIKKVTEQEGNIPLETVARALLPLGFCVVHKDALSTALDAMTTVNTMETDITDSTTVESFERAMKHLQDALTGF